MNDSSKEPTTSVQRGNVKLAIWKKDGTNGAQYSLQVERLYKDEANAWKHTPYLHGADLGNLMLASIAASDWIASDRKEK